MKKDKLIISAVNAGIKTVVIVGIILGIAFTINAEPEKITFKGETPKRRPLKLTGVLMKPEGKGPFPAIILLHGCAGMYTKSKSNMYHAWATRLVSWGYVTFQVDSLGPRNQTSTCDNPYKVHTLERIYDAFAGKSYLESQSYVDDKRIAVMGWSHGAWTALYAVDKNHMDGYGADPFMAAIAFYPYCEFSQIHLSAPLLILIGEQDDWTPAYMCKNMELAPESSKDILLKVYPNANHGFDHEGVDIKVEGHKIKYNPAATKDAIFQVKRFFEKHLQ
jgi:dienelactone hydrolase